MTRLRHAAILALGLVTPACAARETPAPVPTPVAGGVPHRVADGATGDVVGFEALVDRATEADVVFFGEQHDDPDTHRLQVALLESLAVRGADVVLSLEMFERDVQPRLDAYLAGRIDEEAFLAEARPWPNYATDYRPLVEMAKERGWPVVAANVPRTYAAGVAQSGLEALNSLPPDERALIAREIECPRDEYYARFLVAMGAHPGAAGEAEGRAVRYYEAQCVKDETMAESIVSALAAHPDAVVVHVTGAFHSDFGQGVPRRVERRVPGVRTVVVSAVPVAEPSRGSIEEHQGRADYLIFTRDPGAGDEARRGVAVESEPVATRLPITRPDEEPRAASGGSERDRRGRRGATNP